MIRIFCLVLCLAGCVSTPPAQPLLPAQEAATQMTLGERAADIAYLQLGEPYRFGGKAPGGFDCSGLVHYAYLQVGVTSPRTTRQLWQRTHAVERAHLRIGDILFFEIDGKPSHVGLYLGGGRFVHAPSSGKHVSVQTLDAEFYRRAFIRGGRLSALREPYAVGSSVINARN